MLLSAQYNYTKWNIFTCGGNDIGMFGEGRARKSWVEKTEGSVAQKAIHKEEDEHMTPHEFGHLWSRGILKETESRLH